jgi:hypothetical protein
VRPLPGFVIHAVDIEDGVHPVGDEDETSIGRPVKKEVIVHVVGVAVPVARQRVDGVTGDETVEVEPVLPASPRSLPDDLGQAVQVAPAAIVAPFALELHPLRHADEVRARVVERAGALVEVPASTSRTEVALEELTIDRLPDDVDTERFAVQLDQSMRGARGDETGTTIEAVAQVFVDERRVLLAVVQDQFVQVSESLAAVERVQLDGKGWLVRQVGQ